MIHWEKIVDNFTGNEEKCLLTLLQNVYDNCFSSQTIKKAKLEGFSISEINSVITKLEEKKLCRKIPRSLFSNLYGWLYEINSSVIKSCHRKKVIK